MEFLRKISSRKLWAAAAGLIAGLAMVFGLDEGVVTSVACCVVSLGSVVAYIAAEGRIDAAGVKKAAEDVQEAMDELGKEDG